jgi:hypothetical protein
MTRLNKPSKIILILTVTAVLISLWFPPWMIKTPYTFQQIGYHSIFVSPDRPRVKIDIERLIIQIILICVAGFLGIILSPYAVSLFQTLFRHESTETNGDTGKNVTSKPLLGSRFKTREEYEEWKKNWLH